MVGLAREAMSHDQDGAHYQEGQPDQVPADGVAACDYQMAVVEDQVENQGAHQGEAHYQDVEGACQGERACQEVEAYQGQGAFQVVGAREVGVSGPRPDGWE